MYDEDRPAHDARELVLGALRNDLTVSLDIVGSDKIQVQIIFAGEVICEDTVLLPPSRLA